MQITVSLDPLEVSASEVHPIQMRDAVNLCVERPFVCPVRYNPPMATKEVSRVRMVD